MNNFQKLFIWMGLSLISTVGLWKSGSFLNQHINFHLPQFFAFSIGISIIIGIILFSNDKNKKGNE